MSRLTGSPARRRSAAGVARTNRRSRPARSHVVPSSSSTSPAAGRAWRWRRPRQRPARRDGGVAEQRRAGNRVRHLEMAEMVGRVEAVERAVAELVELEVVPLARVVDRAEHEDARSRRRADDVIDDTRAARQKLRADRVRGLLDRRARRRRSDRACRAWRPHPGGVGDDGLLEGDLACHRRRTSPCAASGPTAGRSLLAWSGCGKDPAGP